MASGRGGYAAFVSYSRAADTAVAHALQQGLQRFTKPWYRQRALRVFRDESSLAANPGLWPSIQTALDESEFFVLLASPDAARSEWVQRELAHWLARHPTSNLLIALTDGEIAWDRGRAAFDWSRTTALPLPLDGVVADEPRFVDLRWARTAERLSLAEPRFAAAVADLAAPMHGRPKDELIGEDVHQHRRAVRLARAAIATLAVLALLAGAAGVVAVRQRNDARRERDRAEAQQRLAVSRQLAAQALADLPEQPDRALLLSVESLKAQPGPHGVDALLTSLQRVWTAGAYLDNDAPVHSLAYSPDGRILATGHNDRSVRLWDVARRRPVGDPLTGHQLLVEALAFSPDDETLATVDRDGAVVRYDVTTGERRGPAFGTSVLALDFSSDGTQLATGNALGEVQVWDVATGESRRGPLQPTEGRIHRLVWSPDGALVATVTTAGEVTLWDLAAEEPLARPLRRRGIVVRSLAFSPDGATLALGTIDGRIILWDVASGRQRGDALTAHGAAVLSLDFNRDGTFLASGSADETVIAWELATSEPFPILRGHGDEVRAVAFRPDSEQLASGSFDGSLVLWQTASRLLTPITTNEEDLRSVAITADLTRAVYGQGSGEIYVWDLPGTAPAGEPMRLDGHLPATMAISADGTMAASGDGVGTFVLWDVDARRPIGDRLQSPEAGAEFATVLVLAFAETEEDPQASAATFEKAVFSPNGARLATVSFNNQIVIWDTATHEAVGAPLAGNTGPVASLAFSPDGTTLAAGDLTGGIIIWDVATGKALGEPLAAHDQLVEALAFSPDGTILASGGGDRTVALWDVAGRRRLGERLRGHSSSVVNLAFAPDGLMLASAGSDGSLLLWDVATGQQLGEPSFNHASQVLSLVWAPDGTRLATAASDGSAYWDVDPDSWTASACEIANRNLSRDEWDQLFTRPFEPTC